MISNFLIWDASLDSKKNFCVLDDLENVEDGFELTEGAPREHNFPDNAMLAMDPEYPKSIALADNIFNVSELIVASKALKKFIEERSKINVEYLPVTIKNHKQRVASNDYYIVHPIHLQDGLDIKKSICTWSTIIKDKVNEVERLIIDENRIEPEVTLFRLKYFYRPILVRRDLAEAISEADFTGTRWIELNEYIED